MADTGGVGFNGVDAVCRALDPTRAKWPDLALLHDGSPEGADRIAAC